MLVSCDIVLDLDDFSKVCAGVIAFNLRLTRVHTTKMLRHACGLLLTSANIKPRKSKKKKKDNIKPRDIDTKLLAL